MRRGSIPVNVKHAKGLDAVLTEDALLGGVNGAKTNVDELLDTEAHVVGEPSKGLLVLILGQASQEGNGHAVDVTALAVLGTVNVGVGVNPDDGDVTTDALTGALGRAGNGSDGDAVVAAERQCHAASARVLVRLRGNLAGHGRHQTGALHATVHGVRGGNEVLVQLDSAVAVELVAELVADLGEKTVLDELLGALVDTVLGLFYCCLRSATSSPFC